MATLDLLSIEEARSAINLAAGVTTHDTELAEMVTGISAQVDELCGPVVARAVTETHDGGRPSITLDTVPISSITSVTEYDTAGTSTALTAETVSTKPASGYLLETGALYAKVHRRSSGADSVFLAGRQNVVIVTSAGRYATTAAVGGGFKSAAKSILRAVWQQEAGRWAQSPEFIDDAENDEAGSFLSVEDMVRRRLRTELLGGIVAGLA